MNGCRYFAIFQLHFQLGQNGEGGVDGSALIFFFYCLRITYCLFNFTAACFLFGITEVLHPARAIT